MKINLLSHDNGVGLTQDVKIVKKILSKHEVNFIDLRTSQQSRADVNIFFEILDGRHYDNAKYNLYFPNPEWFWWPKQLNGIDIVLAKTHDAVSIFKQIGHPNVVFISFTSDDRSFNIGKERVYLHTAGQSETKGTQTVFNAWKPNYPQLIFTKLKNYAMYEAHGKNVMTCFDRLPFEVLRNIQNKCAFHICTSEYEGFGHYIWEAKSCGGIVITTDGAPMDEMVIDGVDGFVVPAPRTRKMNFARCKLISVEGLQEVIERTMNLSESELAGMSKASRKRWDDNDSFFRGKLNEIIDAL